MSSLSSSSAARETCRGCQSFLESSWVFCELCGRKVKETSIRKQQLRKQKKQREESIDNVEKEDVALPVHLDWKKKQEKKRRDDFLRQRSLVERVPTNVTLINREEEKNEKPTLLEARRAAAAASSSSICKKYCAEPSAFDSCAAAPEKKQWNAIDLQAERMASFLERFNRSSLLNEMSISDYRHRVSVIEKKRPNKKPKPDTTADFFKSEKDIKTSKMFKALPEKKGYLSDMPSLRDIFNDPTLLPESFLSATKSNDCFISRSSNVDSDLQNKSIEEPPIYFWGKPVNSNSYRDDCQQIVASMKLFKGGFWGAQNNSDSDDNKSKDTNDLIENQDSSSGDEEEDGLLHVERKVETENVDGDINDEEENRLELFDGPPISSSKEIFDRLGVNVGNFSCELGRRKIGQLYRSSMNHLNNAILKGTISFSRDPILQSRPVSLYHRLSRYVKLTINEAELSVKAIDEMYKMCHEDSKARRIAVVTRLQEENRRAADVRHKYSAKYAKVTNKENIDAYSLEMAQNRIREKAEKALDGIRECVNELLREETELVSKLKSEERALELTVVMYSTKHLRLIEQAMVTQESLVSVTRWLAARVIQRNTRFYLLRGAVFKMPHLGTPWFRELLLQQDESS